MTFEAFLRRLVDRVESCEIPYMAAGSVASSCYGESRATQDVDLVVDPTPDQVERFVGAVHEEGYVSRSAALEALRHRSLFNVIDYETGWKADLILRKDRPFSRIEFQRRRSVEYRGLTLRVASPEDVILSKLEWAKLGESERQLRDAAGVYAVMRESLDEDYLDRWAAELDVGDSLRRIREATKDL